MLHPTLQRAPLRAVIFDFDGTLAISTLDYTLMRQRALEAAKAVFPEGFEHTFDAKGRPAMEELREVCEALSAYGEEAIAMVRSAAMDAVKEVELDAAKRSSLFPFVRPMLKALAGRNIQCGIITRNCIESVRIVFPDHQQLCACTLTRDDVQKVKPDPGHLRAALEILKCPAREAMMVGDHPMDIEVGRKTGTRTAGVTSAESSFAELVKEKPTWLAKDAGELMRWLGLMDQEAGN